jgi:hypothetical protein
MDGIHSLHLTSVYFALSLFHSQFLLPSVETNLVTKGIRSIARVLRKEIVLECSSVYTLVVGPCSLSLPNLIMSV